MSTEDNKAVVRRAFEEGWNQGKVAVFDEVCAPNYIYHEPARPDVRTLEDLKRYAIETRSEFPDHSSPVEMPLPPFSPNSAMTPTIDLSRMWPLWALPATI